MNHKLSIALLLPLLVMACSQESTTQKVPMPAPVETQVSNTATQPQIIFLEVSPETRPCTGVAPQTCLLVRELTLSETGQKIIATKKQVIFMTLLTALPIIQSLLKLLRSNAQKLPILQLISLNTNMNSTQLLKQIRANNLITVFNCSEKNRCKSIGFKFKIKLRLEHALR